MILQMKISFFKTVTERRWLIQNAKATTAVWGACWVLLAFIEWLKAIIPEKLYFIYIWVVIPVIIALLARITFGGHYLVRILLYNLSIYGAWLINLYVVYGIRREGLVDAYYWLFFIPSIVGSNVAFFAVAAIAWLLQNRAKNSQT